MSGFQYQYNDSDPMRGGGGFNENQSPNVGTGFSSPEGGNTRRFANKDEQSVIPVTVSMLLRAEFSHSPGGGSVQGYVLPEPDGRECKLVKLVAAVRDRASKSTYLLWNVEDGTGGILEIKKHVATETTSVPPETQIEDNMYVHVVGSLNQYEGKRYLQALSIRPISTGNQVTHHFLEVIYSHERHLKQQSGGGIGNINSIYQPSLPKQQGQALALHQPHGSSGSVYHVVLGCMRHLAEHGGPNYTDEIGCHINQLVAVTSERGVSDRNKVLQAIAQACEDGIVYSTLDDQHYAFSA